MNVLSELKSGQMLKSIDGKQTARVTRVRKSKERIDYDEPMYRVTYITAYGEVTSAYERTLQELTGRQWVDGKGTVELGQVAVQVLQTQLHDVERHLDEAHAVERAAGRAV